jgi:dienelactone hydrolase
MKSALRVHLWLVVAVSVASFVAGFKVSIAAQPNAVTFPSGELVLHGDLYKPEGAGPFPGVIWYHGGGGPRPGAAEYRGSTQLGPVFTGNGYVLFVPHRLGYGRSPRHDLVDTFVDGKREVRDKLQLKLIDMHMKDVIPALSFLKGLAYVDRNRIAVAGCSLGGIQTVLISEKDMGFRAAVAFAAAAQSWRNAPNVRELMTGAVRKATLPILFVQAENDYDLTGSRTLAAEMKRLGKPHKLLIFPPFGNSPADGHAFCTRGGKVWASEVFSFLGETMQR